MNVPRLYRAAIVLFGFSTALNALNSIRVDGLTLLDTVAAIVGVGLAGLTLVARDPDQHGYPTELTPRVYLVVAGAVLFALSVVASMTSLL